MADTNEFFIKCARAQCENSIRNTATGKWLGRALDRLEKLEAEKDRFGAADIKLRTAMDEWIAVVDQG